MKLVKCINLATCGFFKACCPKAFKHAVMDDSFVSRKSGFSPSCYRGDGCDEFYDNDDRLSYKSESSDTDILGME